VVTKTIDSAILSHVLSPKTNVNRVSVSQINLIADDHCFQIVAYTKQLEKDYPNLVKTLTIGQTYEGRSINAVQISSGGNGKRPAVYIEGGIHAREWIAPSTITYLLNQLVENATNANMYANLDWLIVPVTNPDGYTYTRSNVCI